MAFGLSAGSKAAASAFGGITATLVLALVGFAQAQSHPSSPEQPSTTIDQAINTLDQALRDEPGLSEATKRALSQVVGTLRTERAEVVTNDKIEKMVNDYSKATTAYSRRKAFESVFDHLKIYGDFRLRYEVDFDRDSKPDRYRPRIRLRIGMDWQLTDEVSLVTRLSTGDPDDPNSEHQTLGTVFNKYDSNWDVAHISYKPKCVDGLTLLFGKYNNIFYTNPVYGELVWDQDIGADGMAAAYTIKGGSCSKLEKIDLRLQGFDLLESDLTNDVFGLAGQVAATFKLNKCLSAVAAVSYWYWTDPGPGGSKTILNGDNAGNATIDINGDGSADIFQSDFGILNPIVSATYTKCEKWPFTVSAEYILNTLARNDRDQGFAVGAGIGRHQKQGDWRFEYQYQVVQQDAVFSPVAQDDFILQTNFRGHMGGIWYSLTDDINVRLWALIAAREHLGNTPTTDSDQDQWRIRLDMNFRF